jgi:hypothetical protein
LCFRFGLGGCSIVFALLADALAAIGLLPLAPSSTVFSISKQEKKLIESTKHQIKHKRSNSIRVVRILRSEYLKNSLHSRMRIIPAKIKMQKNETNAKMRAYHLLNDFVLHFFS